jgi:hypothetical protein
MLSATWKNRISSYSAIRSLYAGVSRNARFLLSPCFSLSHVGPRRLFADYNTCSNTPEPPSIREVGDPWATVESMHSTMHDRLLSGEMWSLTTDPGVPRDRWSRAESWDTGQALNQQAELSSYSTPGHCVTFPRNSPDEKWQEHTYPLLFSLTGPYTIL